MHQDPTSYEPRPTGLAGRAIRLSFVISAPPDCLSWTKIDIPGRATRAEYAVEATGAKDLWAGAEQARCSTTGGQNQGVAEQNRALQRSNMEKARRPKQRREQWSRYDGGERTLAKWESKEKSKLERKVADLPGRQSIPGSRSLSAWPTICRAKQPARAQPGFEPVLFLLEQEFKTAAPGQVKKKTEGLTTFLIFWHLKWKSTKDLIGDQDASISEREMRKNRAHKKWIKSSIFHFLLCKKQRPNACCVNG